jgi:hypothetical protein
MSKKIIILLVLLILVILIINLIFKKEYFEQSIRSKFCFNKIPNHNIFNYEKKCSLEPIGNTGESEALYYDDLNQCLNICGNCDGCKGFVDYEDDEGLKVCAFKSDTSDYDTQTDTGLKVDDRVDTYIMKECSLNCKQKGEPDDLPLCHNRENCRSHQFDYFPECDQELDPDIPDIHIQRQNDSKMFSDIHYVNPYNPCCLRNCINDFTYANEEEAKQMGAELGDYKSNIPVDVLFSSKCAQCLLRFEPALNMIKSPDKCEAPKEEENDI